MSAPPIRVFLVDDQQMVRAGFRMLVESQDDLTVVGEAGDGEEALRLLAAPTGADRPVADVVLMDVRMPRLDGVEATRALAARADAGAPVPRVIVLTTFDLDEYAFAALRAGASAFLLKDATPPDLLEAVRRVHAGDAVVAPSTTRRLLDHVAATLPDGSGRGVPSSAASHVPHPRLATLTEREAEVLELVARGLSNGEIAAELVLGEATVKTHVGRLLAKTGSRDRVQLVVLAYEAGVVGPG
ncbi:DNA-binding NarL/FixJ family response regulator [Nocardioides zeae]|uniref:DNA-binding NarL/FixJ family response regulator n=1 Tax=Nocardioides zeae TaxID=1457234 RepID=A0ACC6IMI2_9ACTN|nr:response regulator transcription factor [Nocardioides zeae]MDR6173840.1 DNA-binding NarL/FixJ family response regulator [Nocardioides zeae]MDR6211872.1 DNA-binding NarL/FixJ family response regulator [Nocardioides zeae]